MSDLSSTQRGEIEKFLIRQGVTFEPLLAEITDHIGCDIEEQMADGFSFDDAWRNILSALPENHFKNIQQQTMENISKRMNLSQGMSYMALALLFCSMIFKVMHLQYGGVLLLMSFGLIATPLLLNTIEGIRMNREKKGALLVLGIIAGIVLLMVGYSFKILHLPGADFFVLIAIVTILALAVLNTMHVYRQSSGAKNLLTFLHDKYTPGIERFFLILVLPLSVYKVITIVNPDVNFFGLFILLVVIFGAGMQYIALNWRVMESNSLSKFVRIAFMISIFCFTLPFLGPLLPYQFRLIVVMMFCVSAAIVSYHTDQVSHRLLSTIIAVAIPVIFSLGGLVSLSILPGSAAKVVYNIPVLVLLVVAIFLTSKNSIMRTYAIIGLSSYLLEYIAVE
jgi:hypothetical protein